MNEKIDTAYLREKDKKSFAMSKIKCLHNEVRHDSDEFANDSVAEEVLDLNEDLLEKRKERAKDVRKIRLNTLKIEGIKPKELTMGDINVSFYDGALADDKLQNAYQDDSDESEDPL